MKLLHNDTQTTVTSVLCYVKKGVFN